MHAKQSQMDIFLHSSIFMRSCDYGLLAPMTGGLPHHKLSSSCFFPSQEVVPFNLAAFCISFGMYISRMKAIQVLMVSTKW
jgi:hypothetical protein